MADKESNIPLVVDLDNTLIKTDLLVESFFLFIKLNPVLNLFRSLYWLFIKGKAYLKHCIADEVSLDIETLPYDQKVLDYVREERTRGREIILATASNRKYVEQISQDLGIFDHVIASNRTTNQSSSTKLASIKALLLDKPFEYVGDSQKDIPIWKESAVATLVNPGKSVERKVKSFHQKYTTIQSRDKSIKPYIKAIRLHQWAKNVIVFAPILTSHSLNSYNLLYSGLLAFLAFSLCSSSVYLLNDLLDLPSDRKHNKKCMRPFASGSINIIKGSLLIPALLISSFSLALFLPFHFILTLAGYYALTLAYSLYLKQQVIIDVLLLAGLYTIRVISGSAATGISPSFWLLAFSMFIFLSLAFVKRCAELIAIKSNNSEKAVGRGYHTDDLAYLHSMGTSSGYITILIIALYINDPSITALYTTPKFLWLLCPLLLYWITRIWLKTGRGEMNEDPVIFAFMDRQSRVIGLLAIITILFAI